MQDRPTTLELLEALEDFLRLDLMPELSGASSFNVRVAANVAAIVRRELEQGPAVQAAELESLRSVLGESGELADLNAELCQRLRSGRIGLDSPGLVEHLIETTLAKVEIDNPRYSSLAEARELWGGGAAREPSVQVAGEVGDGPRETPGKPG